MVDADSVTLRLQRLEQLLAVLDELRRAGRDQLMRDLRVQLQAEHALQIAIQICIDVGIHIAAERGLPAPSDYRDVFPTLANAAVLDADLAGRLAEAAGLRNVLVHEYASVDHAKLWDSLGDLDDLRAFAAVATDEMER